MQSTVIIRDYPCGSGKTTSMIEGFHSDRRYLVIVPLLTEVDRGERKEELQTTHQRGKG